MEKYKPFIKDMVIKPIWGWVIGLIGFMGTTDTIVSHLNLTDSLSIFWKGLFDLLANTWDTRIYWYVIAFLIVFIWVVFENSYRLWAKYNSQIETEKVFLSPKFDNNKREMWLIAHNNEDFRIDDCRATLSFSSFYSAPMKRLTEPSVENEWLIWSNSDSSKIELGSNPERIDLLFSDEKSFYIHTVRGNTPIPDGLHSIQIKLTGKVSGQDIKPVIFNGYMVFKMLPIKIGMKISDVNGNVVSEQEPRLSIGNFVMGFDEGNYRDYLESNRLAKQEGNLVLFEP